jgi:anion-transporting  ArsA/GET3 family ATPase
VVGGKGGVGKSTVAAALGLAAAGAGQRTLVAELAGRSDIAHLLDHRGGPPLVERELMPGLFHVTIDRQTTVRDYLDHEVPGPIPAGALTRSRAFTAFVDAAPGMGELLSIGKVSELARPKRGRPGAQPYDLIVLDGPASGQLMALVNAPGTFGAIARIGPVARQTADIGRLLRDHSRTGVIVVSTAEQMAVSEAVGLHADLEGRGIAVDAVVVNRTVSSPFTAEDERRLQLAAGDPAVNSARWLSDRARAQRRQIDRLRRDLADTGQTRLPFVFAGIDSHALDKLAGHLWRQLA